jgi:ATP-dependent helicase YprA (DUF1998 family)
VYVYNIKTLVNDQLKAIIKWAKKWGKSPMPFN